MLGWKSPEGGEGEGGAGEGDIEFSLSDYRKLLRACPSSGRTAVFMGNLGGFSGRPFSRPGQ